MKTPKKRILYYSRGVGASLSGDESALDVSRVSVEVLLPITCRVGKKDVSIFLMNEQLHPV